MPSSSHPQAQFVPIPPDLDLSALVENTSNFDYVTRLPKEILREHSAQSLEQLVLKYVIIGGKPLVIEGWGPRLDPSLYSPTWLRENLGTKAETVRDIPNATNIPMTIGHYLKSMEQLTRQFTKEHFRDPKRQRLYLKDIDCPEEWHEHLESILPESLFYLNECIEPRTGGAGAILEPNEYGQMRFGKGVAPAGDLMSSLPEEMRAQNMQCYIGHEGTYTPAHREMCASLGHNIMVEASHDQRGEKAGSSIWFMTETVEREVVSEYFLSMLGHDIEVEKHFAQVNAWKKAPFNVWVVEQKVGDLVLIPPLAPHQVWNRGTRTMKAAWNRTTVDTLELAMHEALPRARMVCRDEQYKNKAIIYYTLQKYYELMQRDTVEPKMWKFGRIKQVMEDFKRLFALYAEILVSESFSPALPKEKEVEFLPYDSNVTCSYCRCNIFNRFLTCKSCIEYGEAGAEDTYDVCMECYAMGRSCGCISNLKWVEQWQWNDLVENYEEWRNLVIDYDEDFDDDSPQPFNVARARYGKKPVAQIVQEQLTIRPWHDIRKVHEPTPVPSDAETDLDDEGRPKKKGKRKSKKKVQKKTHTCHVCMHHEWNWKLAFCTTCPKAYCYGVLWRAFDLMPQTVMENENWQCPECLGICSCGKCRRGKKQKPYSPKGTLLGHDTRAVADFRSVESLVDFSRTNLAWLKGEGDENPQKSSRMKRLKEKAEAEKAKENLDEGYIEGSRQGSLADGSLEVDSSNDTSAIDPSLRDSGPSTSHQNLQNGGDGQAATAHVLDATNGHEIYPYGLDHVLEYLGDNEYQSPYASNFQHDQSELNESARQTAPVAPMFALATSSYPDPSHFGRDRMMGIGYYQQGVNSADKILYDAPESDTTPTQQSTGVDGSQLDPSLADANLQSDAGRKRKHAELEGQENSDEDELLNSSLFKKQRRHEDDDVDFEPRKIRRDNRPTRKSAVKVQNYAPFDEEEVVSGDLEPQPILTAAHQDSLDHEDDLQLATQAMMHLKKAPIKDKPRRKEKDEEERRRNTRGQPSRLSGTPAASVSTEKPRRRSAWLARREAEEARTESPAEQPQRKGRGRPRRSTDSKTKASSHPVETPSEFEDDTEDGGIILPAEQPKKRGRGRPRGGTTSKVKQAQSHPVEISSESEADDDDHESVMISDNDSLFNEPPKSKSTSRGVKWQKSDIDSSVQIAQPEDSHVNDVESSSIVVEVPKEATPITSAKTKPASIRKHLSLKEKMALKGRSFKIVSKQRQSSGDLSNTSSARQTPSSANNVQEKTPSVSLQSPAMIGNSRDTALNAETMQRSSTVASVSAPSQSKSATPITTSRPETPDAPAPRLSSGSAPTVIHKSTPTEAGAFAGGEPTPKSLQPTTTKSSSIQQAAPSVVQKGPTIVRLMESEEEEEEEENSESYASDESSDESIPALKVAPVAPRGGASLGRRGTSGGVRGSRGRGRGWPSLRGY